MICLSPVEWACCAVPVVPFYVLCACMACIARDMYTCMQLGMNTPLVQWESGHTLLPLAKTSTCVGSKHVQRYAMCGKAWISVSAEAANATVFHHHENLFTCNAKCKGH